MQNFAEKTTFHDFEIWTIAFTLRISALLWVKISVFIIATNPRCFINVREDVFRNYLPYKVVFRLVKAKADFSQKETCRKSYSSSFKFDEKQ